MLITKLCDRGDGGQAKRPKQEMNQESIHLGVRKHGSHHGRCPANSTMVNSAKAENKQARNWTKMEAQHMGQNVVAQTGRRMHNFGVSLAGWSTKEYQLSVKEPSVRTIGS